jgi:hypothetical protein
MSANVQNKRLMFQLVRTILSRKQSNEMKVKPFGFCFKENPNNLHVMISKGRSNGSGITFMWISFGRKEGIGAHNLKKKKETRIIVSRRVGMSLNLYYTVSKHL